MGWSRDLGVVTVDEVAGVAKVAAAGLAAAGHSPEECALLAAAVNAAKAGVEAMGGAAHVWLGASVRIGADPEEPDADTEAARRRVQSSFSVTVTQTRQG